MHTRGAYVALDGKVAANAARPLRAAAAPPMGRGERIEWWCGWGWKLAECVWECERGFVFGLEERRKSVKWKRIAWRPGQTKPDAAVRMG